MNGLDGPRSAPASRSFARVRATLAMIRFSHSVFALPFALLSLFLAAGGWPPVSVLAWVIVAMVAARSAAMGVNRILDRRFDAENPRTMRRQLVTGELTLRYALSFTVLCAALFVFAASEINDTAFLLSPAVLVVLFGYSLLKRWTSLAHLGIGLALGLSPLGAWIAGAGGLEGNLWVPIVLGVGVMTWVAGFDVVYACQDVEVDRRLRLHSIPARYGVPVALALAAVLHVVCVAAFAALVPLAGLGALYGGAVGLVALLLLIEHAMVSPENLARVNLAFLTVNGVVSLVLGLAGIADLLGR